MNMQIRQQQLQAEASVHTVDGHRTISKPALRPMEDRLAQMGGRAAVTKPFRERWRNVRWSDALRVLRYMRRDITTEAGGGGAVREFERNFCAMTGSRYGLTMNSGTATLHSAYFALGIGPGDEVVIPTYTFFASAAPVLQCGGTPVFCDIDPRTLTADPDDAERRITSRTKAICVTHVWGNPARLDRFVDIARRHKIALVEDCSHAHGALYQGRPVGSWGDIGCFSLQGGKPINAGEAGIAVTDNVDLYDRMLALGHFGRIGSIQAPGNFNLGNYSLGLKYRPHLYGILIGIGGLRRIQELNDLRRRNYDILTAELADCESVCKIESYENAIRGGLPHFVLRLQWKPGVGWSTPAFVRALKAEGVPVSVDAYTALHREPLFSKADLTQFGGVVSMANNDRRCDAHPMPGVDTACGQTIVLPAFTKVNTTFIRQCGQAVCKVARIAEENVDLRTLS